MFAAAVLLAVLAGFVDAIAYISLGGFFASFMSGNTTRLGVGLATGTAADAWNAGALILAFLCGVVGASILSARFERWRKPRSEEHTSELQSLMRISYAVFCLKKKKISSVNNE